MSTRHSELRLQGTLEPAFLPLNWKIQTGIHIKPIPADLLLLAPGLAVERDGAGLSSHIVGAFELSWTGSVSAGMPRSPPRKSSRRVSAILSQNSWITISSMAALFDAPVQIFP